MTERERDRRTMRDVDHTPPDDHDTNVMWERGRKPKEQTTEE